MNLTRAVWLGWLLVLACEAGPGGAASGPPPTGGPAPETIRAFETYIRSAELRLDGVVQEKDGFLLVGSPEQRARLRNAGIVCAPRNKRGDEPVQRGLIHDWVGAVFIPGVTAGQVLAVLQDYNHHKRIYAPDVIDSRILERDGDDFKVRLRLFKRNIVKVILDTDNEVHYERLGGPDWRSRSYSTRIVEIANPGGAREPERPAGAADHGYLWRLNSYWLIRERDNGVYVECEAISLSRSIPSALSLLIRPVIKGLSKDALSKTLRRTREAVLAGARGSRPAPGPVRPRD